MQKYKFFTRDRRGPHSGVEYPLDVLPALERGQVRQCMRGWHACAEEQVWKWVNWRVAEVEAPEWVELGDKCATAHEVRIVREGTIDIAAYAQACTERAQMRAADARAAWAADAAWAAWTASAVEAEHAWQSQWIVDHIHWEA